MKALVQILILLAFFGFEAKSQTTLTNGQVYDYNINDEFHYYHSGEGVTPNATRFTITDKYYSALNDTIFYIRHFDNYTTQVIFTPNPHLEYFFNSYNDLLIVTQLDSLISSQFITWPINDTLGNWFNDTSYISSDWCEILTYEYSACINCNFEGYSYQGQYGQGVGLIRETHSSAEWPSTDYQYYLRYFKKDNFSCGIPDLTTVGIAAPVKEETDFSLYPNPAKDFVKLKNNVGQMHFQYILTDASGNLIETMNLNGEINTINLQKLNAGFYILKIITAGKTTTLKLIKE